MSYQDNSQFEEKNNNKEKVSNSNELKNQFCPYLGLKFDPKTWVGYPSPLNYCHRVKPLAVPKFEHQISHCLSKNFIDCPIVYGGPGQRMPKAIQSQSIQRATLKKIIKIEVMIGVALIAVILGAIFWNQIIAGIAQIGESASREAQTNTQESIFTKTASPTAELTPTFANTSTATIENSPNPTQTPIPPSETPLPPTSTIEPPILALETPIGRDKKFIIHAVIPGESLELYAKNYNTTVPAIRAVNYDLPSFLPLDWVVIIPLNTSDVTDIPPFEPFEVKEAISVGTLAEILSVDLTDLRLYNRIPSGYALNPGEWILIPRETPKP